MHQQDWSAGDLAGPRRPLMARGMVGWQHVFGDVTPKGLFAFAGAPIARDALVAEAGLEWRGTTSVGLFYDATYGSGAYDNAIKARSR